MHNSNLAGYFVVSFFRYMFWVWWWQSAESLLRALSNVGLYKGEGGLDRGMCACVLGFGVCICAYMSMYLRACMCGDNVQRNQRLGSRQRCQIAPHASSSCLAQPSPTTDIFVIMIVIMVVGRCLDGCRMYDAMVVSDGGVGHQDLGNHCFLFVAPEVFSFPLTVMTVMVGMMVMAVMMVIMVVMMVVVGINMNGGHGNNGS